MFDFGPKPAGQKEIPADPFLPRPEIKHIFRPDAQRAPVGTTSIFVILVLAPIAVFLLGVRLSLHEQFTVCLHDFRFYGPEQICRTTQVD